MGFAVRLADTDKSVSLALDCAQADDVVRRLWAKDPSLWSDDTRNQTLIAQRLGWLRVAEMMREGLDDLIEWTVAVGQQVDDIVLLGMGGSSLAAEVMVSVVPPVGQAPTLTILDTTNPAAVHRVEADLDLERTLFIVASKSGNTIETEMLAAHFWRRYEVMGTDNPGQHFVAITDPGSELEKLALARMYRRTFLNPIDIGGRYSALSFFGLVPAALASVDVATLLNRAVSVINRSSTNPDVTTNEPIMFGVALAAMAHGGRDKLSLVPTPTLVPMGSWIEQLVAESTGKGGKGIIPIEGETVADPGVYRSDRVFVHLLIEGEESSDQAAAVDALAGAGHPVVTARFSDPLDLGAHFLEWELAVATAGYGLNINPFDEPDVSESKRNTRRVLDKAKATGRFPPVPKGPCEEGVVATGSSASDLASAIVHWLDLVGDQDYVSIHAYVDRVASNESVLRSIQTLLRNHTHCAVTLGYGPRFLHSAGQLHKGGPDTGVFLQITSDHEGDVRVPATSFSLGNLLDAQAAGDLESLICKNRRYLRIHMESPAKGLVTIERAVRAALDGRGLVAQ